MAYDQRVADLEKSLREWRAVADALAMVLRKNGVGGRQWQAAMDLYEQASAEQGGAQ